MSNGPSAGAQGGSSRKHTGYAVDVVRDGAWWMVHIADLGGLTQARRLGEVMAMAREWVALDRDVSVDDVQVWLRRLDVNGADVGLIQEGAAGKRPEATAPEAQLSDTTEAFSPYDVSDYLVTAEDAAAYLEATLEEVGDDPAAVDRAVAAIARSRVGSETDEAPGSPPVTR